MSKADSYKYMVNKHRDKAGTKDASKSTKRSKVASKNSQIYLNNIRETSNPRSGLNESHIISIPLKIAFRRTVKENNVFSSPESIVSDNSQGYMNSGKFSRHSIHSAASGRSRLSNSIYLEKSTKLSLARSKA